MEISLWLCSNFGGIRITNKPFKMHIPCPTSTLWVQPLEEGDFGNLHFKQTTEFLPPFLMSTGPPLSNRVSG